MNKTVNITDPKEITRIQSIPYQNLNTNLIVIDEWDGIDHNDAPDYCDAYVISASYAGVSLSDIQIEDLNEDHDFVYEALMSYLY